MSSPCDEAKIPLEADVPSFGSWNLGIRLGKLNLLQFDVLNVKIKAQEVRRWSVLGIKRKHCPCGCSSPYSNTPGWPWTLLVVLLRRGELLGRQEVVLLGRCGPRGLIPPFIDIFLQLYLSKYSILRKNHIDNIRVALFLFR